MFLVCPWFGLVAREIADLVSDNHGPRLVGLVESRPDEHQCKIVAVHNQLAGSLSAIPHMSWQILIDLETGENLSKRAELN